MSVPSLPMNPVYRCGWLFFRAVFRPYFRWRVFHPERVPLAGPLIIASNHASYLDPAAVGAALPREMHYLARRSLMLFSALGWLMRNWNVIPVDREGGGAEGMKVVLEVLRQGKAIIMFPEGTRTWDGQLQPARSGVGLLVVKSAAPVLPVRVFGSFEAMGRKVWFPKPCRMSVKFGRPLRFDALLAEIKTADKQRQKAIYQQITDEIMAAIGALEPKADAEP